MGGNGEGLAADLHHQLSLGAQAVFVLCSPELSRTTGLHIPVDSGVAAAFLR